MTATGLEFFDELEDEFEEEAMELAPFFARGGALKFGWPARARRRPLRAAFPVDFGDELEEELMELESLFPRRGSIAHPYGNEKWGQAFNKTIWAMPEFEGDKPKPCKDKWVPDFARGSSKLQPFQKKHINDLMTDMAKSLLPKLKGSDRKDIDFEFSFEGHVDKDTDPKNYGTLDEDRALAVREEIRKSSTVYDIFFNQLAAKNLPRMSAKFWPVTRVGSTSPFSATNKNLNRVVRVCVSWTIKPAP
jgi:hypothetical protein